MQSDSDENQIPMGQPKEVLAKRRLEHERVHPIDIANRFSSKHELYQYIDEHLVSDVKNYILDYKLYNTY